MKLYNFPLFLLFYHNVFACTTIIVGRGASTDHSIMIARNVDSLSNKPVHFIYHPKSYNKNYIYSSLQNNFKYKMPTNLLGYSGIPDPNILNNKFFEEAGFNDLGIAVSGTETISSNRDTLKRDPYNKISGIKEDAIPSILLPQIKSAKDGVILLGNIIEKYGSGEGFGVAFADQNEAWYLENAGGHSWVAVRIPDNMYFVSANQGRISQININDRQNVLVSSNIAKESTNVINFYKCYTANSPEDINYNYYRVWSLQKLYTPSFKNNLSGNFPVFLKPDHLISTKLVESGLRLYYHGTKYDPYTSTNLKTKYRPVAVFRTQESHILKLRNNLPITIANTVYLSLGMTNLSIYIPFYYGADIPEEYKTGDFFADNISAFWRFRKLQILVMHNFKDYAPIVEDAYAKLSDQISNEEIIFEKKYLVTYSHNKIQAQIELNNFTKHIVTEVFTETDHLTNQIMTLDGVKINKQYLFYGN